MDLWGVRNLLCQHYVDGGGGGNASRHRPSTRERLAELAGLRDAKLVSAQEYATARMSILDDLVRGVAGASRT